MPSISKKVQWLASPTSSISPVRRHFCTSVRRLPAGCSCPIRYGTRGCIPAVVNSTEGSFSGMSEAEGITLWPRSSKNFRYSDLS